MNWRPSAAIEELRARAGLLARIRAFFASRDVLEVETPLLCSRGVTDPAIEPLCVDRGNSLGAPRFLQTSPEYAMKRLLAAGSGPIYQLARAFRDGEAGSRHNPEFSLLEWYRPGLDHHQLMTEVAELVTHCLGPQSVEYHTYRDLFRAELGLDPLTATVNQLQDRARESLDVGSLSGDRDMWLDLLMSHLVEPALADRGLCFVYDYPASQAALARVEEKEGQFVAQRFELYVRGMEIANGYCELTDASEQRRRFVADNRRRSDCGQAQRPLDEWLLSALESGMPACSGVALGVDRLLMLATGKTDIRQVLAFDWARC
ncbi:EF-P lysine aminoacylase GenX [Seongchinamella unica]|uniref:EF-P lysine aminoacylase GenX n=1 Tax=Seongchinamella unica TaxID=2547392 RepID=A0A4R5LVX8_9GAMM|nr:EF-P lysine aminoacylase EpmA [Seongchinamella unica]TDG15603.1 EF-P lysine aminoacylase GenX [Seongchinamella unica]